MKINRIEQGITLILNEIEPGWQDDPHLMETPGRAAKGLMEVLQGYKINPETLLKTFEEKDYDQMITIGPIKSYSLCAHHLLPFNMEVYIGYIPDGKIAGISKFVRITQAITQRLQLQEKITEDIAEVIDKTLKPRGVIVVIKNSRHYCMAMRGVKNDTAAVSTSAIKGVFNKSKARAEFYNIINK
jgi:GTP cyclohydrolase I